MDQTNFEDARRYALERLERELSPVLRYHNLAHTRDEVAGAVTRLAALEGVQGEALQLLYTAAYYHDLGYVERPFNNEAIAILVVAEALPSFGYRPAHIKCINGIILATRVPQTPHTLLEKIMADADMDILGREDYFPRNQDLRAEQEALGQHYNDEEWYSSQLNFLRSHHYFTYSARVWGETRKQANIQELEALLESCRGKKEVEYK